MFIEKSIPTSVRGFKVYPFQDVDPALKDEYKKRIGTDAEVFYLVAMFISCLIEMPQREDFGALKDADRADIAKEWLIKSRTFYMRNFEEPDVVY